MATFSTSERKRRPRGDRKSQEMTMHLQQTFNAAILTSLHPRSQIDIFVEVKTPSFLFYSLQMEYMCNLLILSLTTIMSS